MKHPILYFEHTTSDRIAVTLRHDQTASLGILAITDEDDILSIHLTPNEMIDLGTHLLSLAKRMR